MYKTEFLGENLINEISKKYCKGKYIVKKIIYLMTSVLVFFCFTTESFASVKYNDVPKFYTLTKLLKTENEKLLNKEYGPVPIKLLAVENTLSQEKEPVCNQTSIVTVVDSKQVKVKYDFWIIKIFKKLFEID